MFCFNQRSPPCTSWMRHSLYGSKNNPAFFQTFCLACTCILHVYVTHTAMLDFLGLLEYNHMPSNEWLVFMF